MIFVTVGTHEQPFNRLVECVDKLVETGKINEEVFIQTGYSTYEPKYCKWSKLLPYQEMVQKVQDARIVITHGGPSSFIMPLQIGKIPIVVPRQKIYSEHVNNHQLDFCHEVEKRMGNIIVADEKNLQEIINNYSSIVSNKQYQNDSNNTKFCEKIEKMVGTMFGEI